MADETKPLQTNEPTNAEVRTARNIGSHFLDSGSFALASKAEKYAAQNKCGEFDWYDTQEFYDYVASYIEFLSRHKDGADLYANVDVIGSPERSWEVWKHLRNQGLRPVPVLHFGSSIEKWLPAMVGEIIDDDDPILAIGGLARNWADNQRIPWLDEAFNVICDTDDRTPLVRVHGFGVGGLPMILRYPWWSVDHTTCMREATNGKIILPKVRNKSFDYFEPRDLFISDGSIDSKFTSGFHYRLLTKNERKQIDRWIEYIDIPLGESDGGDVVTPGLTNDANLRTLANIRYYEGLAAKLPEYPRTFNPPATRPTLGLV